MGTAVAAADGGNEVAKDHGSFLNLNVRIGNSRADHAEAAHYDHQQQRSLALYALYNFAPFVVTITTLASSELRAEAQEGSGLFVETSTSAPASGGTATGTAGSGSPSRTTTWLLSNELKSITQTALEEHFMKKIGESVVAESHEAEAKDGVLPEIFLHLVSVDLRIKLYFADEDMIRLRGRSRILAGRPEESSVPLESRNLVEHITIIAEMEGTAAFLEPHEHRYKPTNEDVWKILGDWTADYFQNNRGSYLTELEQSDQKAFQDIKKLKIETNIDDVGKTPSPVIVSDGWGSRAERAILVLLIIIAVMALTWIVLYVYHKRRISMELLKLSYSDSEPNETTDDTMVFLSPAAGGPPRAKWSPSGAMQYPARGRVGSMDAVRHGGDTTYDSATNGALQILNASDRYLSKHRPDLFEALNGKPAPPGSSPGEAPGDQSRFSFPGFGASFSSLSQHDDFSTASSAASKYFGGTSSRKYVIPSNPFEYIYSAASAFGSYQRPTQEEPSQQAAMEMHEQQHRRSSFTSRRSSVVTLDEQQENFAAAGMEVDHDYPDDERQGFHGGVDQSYEVPHYNGYTPISSLWRNISNMVGWDDAASMRSSQDGLKFVGEGEEESGLDLPQFHHEYHDDPEEEDYNFAFKDFPRHDGTPCVMYDDFGNSTIGGMPSSPFVIGGGSDDDIPTQPVSDAAFQRMLSQQSGLEDIEYDDPDTQIKVDDMEEEEEVEDIKPKLERILEMRHRQIQKRGIVEKHREARARERKEQREQERRERHRAMEMEIENLEFESFSPLATRGRGKSKQQNAPLSPTREPNHYGNDNHGWRATSPKRANSPKPYKSFSPKPPKSPMRNRSPTRTREQSPMRFIASRSPQVYSAPDHAAINGPGSEIFRPNPKSSYHDAGASVSSSGQHHATLRALSSSESAGLESANEKGGSLQYRPRESADGMGFKKALHVDTFSRLNGGGNFDNLSLDKLSLPSIGNGNAATSETTKNPSPNSVMDDIFTPSKYLRKNQAATNKPAGRHRRVSSFGAFMEDASRGMDGSSHGGYGTPVKSHKYHHRRVNSGQQHNFYPSHHLPPANHQPHYRGAGNRGINQQFSHHRRSNSQDIRRTISHGNRSGGGHSRSNSQDTDVLMHGVYAHTRFV